MKYEWTPIEYAFTADSHTYFVQWDGIAEMWHVGDTMPAEYYDSLADAMKAAENYATAANKQP